MLIKRRLVHLKAFSPPRESRPRRASSFILFTLSTVVSDKIGFWPYEFSSHRSNSSIFLFFFFATARLPYEFRLFATVRQRNRPIENWRSTEKCHWKSSEFRQHSRHRRVGREDFGTPEETPLWTSRFSVSVPEKEKIHASRPKMALYEFNVEVSREHFNPMLLMANMSALWLM